MTDTVYISKIPTDIEITDLYPPQRNGEIQKCKSPRVRAEKYYVWRILEKAITEALNIPIEEVSFTKTENGKWIADKLCFSISHTYDAVAVAISDNNIGVDIEALSRYKKRIAPLTLTEKETVPLKYMSEDMRAEYVMTKWTQKESIFKTLNEKAFLPNTVETSAYPVKTEKIDLADTTYLLSVCQSIPSQLILKIV